MKAFETRLLALKKRMEAGLFDRATGLRGAADRLDGGDQDARREIKTQSHKLRGIAGTYGHPQLTDMAAQLEQRASLSPPAAVAELARELADRAEEIGAEAERPARGGGTPLRSATGHADPQCTPKPEVGHRATVSDAPGPNAGTRPLRVLAMDDDPVTLKLLRLTLREVGGFDAAIVESAQKGLAKLQVEEFDVVVSDAMMPDMNGLEFCRAARTLGDHCAAMPIIILSAATADELGWSQSLDERTIWLRKPFRPTALVQQIAAIVENYVTVKP